MNRRSWAVLAALLVLAGLRATGPAAQNAMLEASALGLGSCAVGAFDDAAVARQLGLASGETPLLMVPVGRPGSDLPGTGRAGL